MPNDKSLSQVSARYVNDASIDPYRKPFNDRKREAYWIGFLQGTLASHRIEEGEEIAILAEAQRFAEFFADPDASDLAADLAARCFDSEQDMIAQIVDIVDVKRSELMRSGGFTETDEINEFLGLCAGIVCDGRILQPEVKAILNRFRASEVLMNASALRGLRQSVERSMEDSILTQAEGEEVAEWLAYLVGDGYIDTGLTNIGNVAQLDGPIVDPKQIQFNSGVFVLTGPMRIGPRSFIATEIERCGAVFAGSITKKTTYVVVSSEASRNWKTTHYGNKIERAFELIEEGHPIRFVSESALEQAFQQYNNPAF